MQTSSPDIPSPNNVEISFNLVAWLSSFHPWKGRNFVSVVSGQLFLLLTTLRLAVVESRLRSIAAQRCTDLC
ncbi:hypothetical protein [Halotia branconii]|uniref:Uncharacterized protein n=1 Tax=Halotia branconii CENA392 TaxID=1539056 RepID=A0AAJ6P7J7_9CYAN|nr:hypothetical protein [Halotia branconii]WGV23804.1 hypothetical protein QI031_18545 [Halotia branconii CENA392]